ncbi:MAG: ATP-binding protein [Acetobacteraceae bacterium]|nr:ATP-binding protein [Acetobacteraceae bacterium]MDW8397482.1 ATP-binding protein [Acetobacteraceae bacterium]
MSPLRLLGAGLLIGGLPTGLFLVFGLTGAARSEAALLGAVLSLGGGLLLGGLWLASLERLREALRRAAAGDEDFGTPPPLPAAAEVAGEIGRLARTLQQRSAELSRIRRADAAILENLPDPLLLLAEDRRLLRANRAARALLGASATDPGDAPALLRHPALADALDRARSAGHAAAAELSLPVPVPREFSARVLALDPPLADGGAILVLLADRTRERAVERMRADFVTNASHELRTPLASLLGFIETLRGPAEEDPEARRRFLAIMAEQAERMQRLLDDLLSLSRIETEEHRPPEGEADLAAILRAEAAALAPLFAARGATLEIESPPALLARPADADQLAQVVRNLLDNALRHGREGGRVQASLASAPAEGGRPGVVLAVTDDGPGIPREHIPRLTERFYRVDRGRSRKAGGTGLGLAIVKHIVSRHRGRLEIESEEGKGATFRVWLPADQPGASVLSR